MVTIFGLGLSFQVLGLLLGRYIDSRLLEDLPLHGAVEMAGAVIGAMVAYLLLRLDSISEGSSFNHLIASALLSMACLDGLHSLLIGDNTFVWLHSLATAVGGFLFAMIWLPGKLLKPFLKYWPPAALLASLALGGYSIIQPEQLPQMIDGGKFTLYAVVLNMGGGILMILAAIRLFLAYRRTGKPEDLLFFFQCLILASAAIMFKQSSIWDLPWWSWHVVRLAGYSIALWLIVKAANDIEAKTLLNNQLLSHQIAERKQVETDLRIAAAAFESHEGMMITDAKMVILRVNRAFTEVTGYTAEEVIGQTPQLLKSGRHNTGFYQAMWASINQSGTWQGEVWDRRKNGEIYPKWLTISAVKGNNGVVTHYVGIHVDITERKAAEKEIQLLAYYDPLTRLPNRRLLMDRLQQAIASSARTGREGALLLIDLDNFKTLNDTLGHQVGDQLLQQIAQRLEACVRDGDTVARLGGDEFVVILENLSEQALEAASQTETVGEKILASLGQPYQFATHVHQSTASIGVTLFDDKNQATNELLKQADIAMYQAKKASRNTLRFFDPKMQASINARVSLESELRKALESQQFQLYYQIQVDSSHWPLGAEVLIRWLHPERGMVSPMEFIPLAEETGLILPIGQWVLDTACAQIKTWQQDPVSRDLVLAVNVSAKQFRQADFVAQVQATLQRHDINPTRLKIELTESLLLYDIEDTIDTMKVLSKIGVQFSLDDFGTGYSSLQYLKRLPLDQIKIDQSFVRNITTDVSDRAIVRTIIAMAHSMDISVIAEGVETEEQRQLLLKSGCINFQGYLFSKPVPIEQFGLLLNQGRSLQPS